MTRILITGLAVLALAVSLLCGVLGVFSVAIGDPLLTVVLLLIAAGTAWVAFALPTRGGPRRGGWRSLP
jgi:hypothetical protein